MARRADVQPPQATAGRWAQRDRLRRVGAQGRALALWVARREIWLLAVVVPTLVVAPWYFLPAWLVLVARCAVPLLFIIHQAAYGRFTIKTPQELPLLLLLIMYLVGMVVTVDMSLTMHVIKKTALALAIFFLINHIRTQEQLVVVTAALLGAGVVIGGAGLLGTQWITSKFTLLTPVYQHLPHVVFVAQNPQGFNPNIVGGSLSMMAPVGLGLTATCKGMTRLLCLLAAVLLLVVAILSQARGALLGLGVGLAVMAIVADRRLLWLGPLVVGAALVVWLRLGTAELAGLVLVTDGSGGMLQDRLELWQRAIYMMQDFSYTGIGPGTFSRILPILYPPFLAPPDAVISNAHQMYLQAGVDFGMPGFVAFIALLATLVLVGVDSIRMADPATRLLAAGFFAGFVVYLIHGWTEDVTFNTTAAVMLWAIAGLMVAQWRLLYWKQKLPLTAPAHDPVSAIKHEEVMHSSEPHA